MKPPFTYFGGKTAIAERIVALLPPHVHYVEPFAGSLAVLLAKPPSLHETVNDADRSVMTFWRVLRERPEEFKRACAMTPHSRAEHQAAYEPCDDEMEQARRTWVRLTQGRSPSSERRTGWRYFQNPGSALSMPSFIAGYVARIAPAAERLVGVSLECRPALELIEMYGQHRDVLLYCDPPYLGSLRTWGNTYTVELRTDDEHRELLKALLGCRAAVVLSGYASPLYDDLLCAWSRHAISTQTANGRGTKDRTEVLWSNRPFAQATLFGGDAA